MLQGRPRTSTVGVGRLPIDEGQMRAPRYKFPNQVRNATRVMAGRMVQQGRVPHTPEELDRWISEHPDVRAPLVEGGFGSQFDAGDLMPLLEVFVVQAGGTVAQTEAPPPTRKPSRPLLALLGAVLLGILIALAVLM
jgi:hypothetical protein